MKKLFYIFAILFTVFNTTAWGASDTKTITVEWTLRLPEKNYSGQISSGLYVYDQDEQCTIKDQDPKLIGTKHENKSWHHGISITSKQSQGSTKLLCPNNLTSLTLVFDFNNGKGIVHTGLDSMPLSANAASFTKTFDISKQKKIKIDETIETVYDMQNRLTREAAQNFCIDGTFSRKNYAFCCTKGIKNNDTNGLQNALNKIAGTNMIKIDTSCQNNTADERQRANKKYADALKDPNNWQKYEAQPAVSAPRTDATTSNTITISGTVNDDTEALQSVNVYAIDSNGKMIQTKNGYIGASTDINGHFEIENFPSDARLQISYTGYETQTFTVEEWENQNNETTLKYGIGLEEVTTTECNLSKRPGTLKGIPLQDGGCQATECDEPRYTLENANTPQAKCVEKKCEIKNGTGKWTGDKRNWKCTIDTCKPGYKPNGDNNKCIEMAKKCNENDAKNLENAGASDTGLRAGTEECIALDCKCGYTLDGKECVQWKKDQNGKYTKPCEKSELEKLNAKSGILACNDRDKAFCEITECIGSDYTHNTEKNTCDSKNKQPCDPMPENTTDAKYERVDGKLVCIINKCADGYERNKDKTKCNPTPKLSEEDSKKKIAELQENADAMRAKEQSTANKLLGGTSMAATGIGGMQLAGAMAEQQSDEDAEEAMRAYLATFHCNYGGGMNIPGGEKDVQLPGGNELVGLYSEYVNLANDLKVRKNALGMKPGIESESILDSATSGLYDDVAIGKTSGTFTSLARAMMDPNGADAAAWAAQKADTAEKLKTGATMAGIGAIGGAAGNLLINKNAPKENSRKINAEYDLKRQIFQELEIEINNLPTAPVPTTTKCPDGANDTYPNCTCKNNNQIYVETSNQCDTCPGDKININGKCDCQSPLVPGENDSCVNPTPSDKCPGDNRAYNENTRQCICINGYQPNGDKCECPNETHHVEDEQCIKNAVPVITPDAPQEITINLPADTLFAHGSAELTEDAKNALNNFITNLSTKKFIDCKIEIRGYTDGTGTDQFNKNLSQKRADAVKNYLISQKNSPISTNSTATGMGEGYCSCAAGEIPSDKEKNIEYKQCVGKTPNYTNNSNLRFAPCRKVTITVNADNCKSTMENATINLLDKQSNTGLKKLNSN